MNIKVILEEDEDGGYVVYAPSLNGCISQGDTKDEALINIKEAIELYIEPKFIDSYFYRGKVKFHFKDYKGALEDFNITIELDPNYVEAYDHRALVKSELGDYLGAKNDRDISQNLRYDEVPF